MAWSYTSGTATSRADFLSKLNTFLVSTLGWTLHDDLTGSSPVCYVWKSTGEDGTQVIFIRMWISTTADRLGMIAYRFWDEAAHTGYTPTLTYAAGGAHCVAAEAGFVYFLYGDKNTVYAVTKKASDYYCISFGQVTPAWSSSLATTANAESAGSNVEIEVDTVVPFEAGKKYQIMNFNSATGNPELVTVSSVGASSIVVATLANDHPAGAVIGELPGRNYAGGHTGSVWLASCQFWKGDGSPAAGLLDAMTALAGYADPDAQQGYYWCVPVFLGADAFMYGSLRNAYRVSPGSVIASEDTIVINGVTYKYFYVYSGSGICIKQG